MSSAALVAVAAPPVAAVVAHNVTAYALLNLTLLAAVGPAHARQLSVSASGLFDFDVGESISALKSQVASWRDAAAASIHNALSGIPGLDAILAVIRKSVELAERGLKILVAAALAVAKLGSELFGVYTTFKPLIPVFESDSFLIDMITKRENLRALLSVIRQLFATAATLKVLSSVCDDSEQVFKELSNIYDSAMGKLSEEEQRRLRETHGPRFEIFSYKKFLAGIDFAGLRTKMLDFGEQAAASAATFGELNTTLSPVLDSLEHGRAVDVDLKPEDYEKAIDAVVPAWQAVEGLGLNICKGVMAADHEASALVCRVHNFVKKAGDLFGLKDLLGECPISTEEKECPKKLLSDDVADQIKKHSHTLGWLMYLLVTLASCGCLGGTAMGIKKMRASPPSVTESAPLVQH
eukprot:SRR837773.7776.p1 GENE.SRR837773.7776~~SRR837773.7776.p1  ORF type:complete len:423 (+),score=192.68 SRR837773.7776:45-1271(+)